MPAEPSGSGVYSPKIRDEALVRKFVSLNSPGYVAISIQQGATPVDPDEGTLQLGVWFNDVLTNPTPDPAHPWGTQVLALTPEGITRTDVGKYYYDLGPALTANRGLLTVQWVYEVNGQLCQFLDHLQILGSMPLYDSLSDQERSVVEQVSWMFGDLYDSTEGGPHLIEEFQTHWDYERIAQMMRIAVNRMNFIGNYNNPPTTWSVGHGSVSTNQVTAEIERPDGSTFIMYANSGARAAGGTPVPASFIGLTVLGTYVEVLRHLRDSYTEIPARPGMDVTYTDRRDYWQRWSANLQAEDQEWKMAVKKAKASLLSLSRGSLLVAGGIYGGSSLGIFQAGTYAAQVRSWRFYPSAPAISWGATRH